MGAIERRSSRFLAVPAIAYAPTPPGQVSLLHAPTPGQTVAASPLLGPIPAPPVVTRTATIRARALRSAAGLRLARLSCSADCVATATIRHGVQVITRRVAVTPARPQAVILRAGVFPRRASALTLTVRFDGGGAIARGTVSLR